MALNPVERRLALLCGEWMDFRADASKRLLVWQMPENAMRLVECFFEVQKLDLEYSSRDLFIVLKPAFEHSVRYARELKVSLLGQYEASKDDLAAQGLASDWAFAPTQVPDSPAGVIAALRSFGSKYHRTIGHLAAVLQPLDVADPSAFSSWVLRALAADVPERLRLVVVDSLEHPRFPDLSPQRDPRIALERPGVDGLSTAQETFAQEPTAGPAGVFRNLMMGVVTLIEKGTADQVKAKATDALSFARKQGWADQEVVIRVLVAGALLKESRHQEAISVYRAARKVGARALEAEHPAGGKLVLQTWFGEAGTCLAAGRWADAAQCYDEAAIAAQRDRNDILALEASRMAAFCSVRAGDSQTAIERGTRALKIGENLEPEARGMTTMPLAAVDLLRAIEPDRISQMERAKGRMEVRLAHARQRAEQRAIAAEQAPDSQRAQEIEAKLERESEQAREDAERELSAIVAAAGRPFQDRFEHARRLLGASWPMESPMALQPVVESAPTGVPAS